MVSEGDLKASVGIQQVGDMLKSKGVPYGSVTFSASLPAKDQNQKVQQLISKCYGINFVQFAKETVVPTGTQGPEAFAEYMYSFDHAYTIKSISD